MACCCNICGGKGVTVENTERGTTLTELCWSCQGTGNYDEVEVAHGSPAAKAMIEAAARRKAGLRD